MANIRKPVNAHEEIKKRAPIFDRKDRISFVEDPKYYRVWVNDVKNEVQEYLDSGFTFVSNDERWGKVNQRDINDGTPIDSRVSVNVGKAGGEDNVTGFLMQVPIDEWEEMRAPLVKEARESVNGVREQAKAMLNDGFYTKQ
jgi:hypothetical protein